MLYIAESDIIEIGTNWRKVFATIEDVTDAMMIGDFSQPLKPYLRFNDPINRIIAMPGYVGGKYNCAGLKWIASFPGNVRKGLARASSIMILNNAETGAPTAIINSARLSAIRTAGISGVVIHKYLTDRGLMGTKVRIGIIGLGVIGRIHLDMINSAFPDVIEKVYLYDIAGISLQSVQTTGNLELINCRSWEEVFDNSDIFITCTVGSTRYINKRTELPSLHLNVSLRDYCAGFMDGVDLMIVDSWEEVCREGTDIAFMHRDHGLQQADVYTMVDVVCRGLFKNNGGEVVMFNPMGMAVYDIAIAKYYHDLALAYSVGLKIEKL